MIRKVILHTLICLPLFILAGSSCTTKITFRNDIIRTAVIPVTLPPNADTVSLLTLATGAIDYNVDSLIQHAEHTNPGGFDINQLVSAKITSSALAIKNATTTGNIANFENCSLTVYTDIASDPQSASLPAIPDVYASEMLLGNTPSGELKNYLISGNGAHVKTFFYTLTGKLRRPIADTLFCTINSNFKLHLEKMEKLKHKASDYVPRK